MPLSIGRWLARILCEGISDALVRGRRGKYHVQFELTDAKSWRKRASVAESAEVMIDERKQTQYIESMFSRSTA